MLVLSLISEQNGPILACTAGILETSLPLDYILLDGSNSTDDQKITLFLWQQTGYVFWGPFLQFNNKLRVLTE